MGKEEQRLVEWKFSSCLLGVFFFERKLIEVGGDLSVEVHLLVKAPFPGTGGSAWKASVSRDSERYP